MATPKTPPAEHPATKKPAAPQLKSKKTKLTTHLRTTDAQGLIKLVAQATVGITDIAENVHHSVLRSMRLVGHTTDEGVKRTGGISGLVYGSVRGITRLVDKGLNAALTGTTPFLNPPTDSLTPSSSERLAVMAALNGVLGDHLAASGNPLATPMQLFHEGEPLPTQKTVNGKVLLLVHGLCMNDVQWQRDGHNHGTHLAQTLGYTPIYLRYNTGLHTSINGRELAQQLQRLQARWPVPIESITLVVHSMGGLVARSACDHAAQAGQSWLQQVDKLIFLGTPHHGAPLERAGNWVDVLLGSNRWSAPFTKLAQIRSSGITDLRYGHTLDAHWQGKNRFRRTPDTRTLLPLPTSVACYAIAATMASKRNPIQDRLMGDGLVPLPSALGEHAQTSQRLQFPANRQFVAYGCNHMQLLNQPQVAQKLATWLAA